MKQKSNELTLPCGCVIWNEGEAFVFKPHAMDCGYYLYFLEQSQAQGKPVTARLADG